MKLYKTIAPMFSLIAALAPFMAQAQTSYNLGFVSLYKSSGVDQDNPDSNHTRPAIQGGIDHDFGNGLYVGNWNSTGQFAGADVEIDIYGGYRDQITDSVHYDLGYAHYYYPGAEPGWKSGELYGSLILGPLTIKLTHGVTPGVNKKSERFSIKYDGSITEKLNFFVLAGFRNNKAGDFDDYALGLTYDLGADMSGSATLSGASKNDANPSRDARLVLGVSKYF